MSCTDTNEWGCGLCVLQIGITMSHAVQATEVKVATSQRLVSSPYSYTLKEEIVKATYSLKNFTSSGSIKNQSIPLPLLTHAKGIAVRR